MNNLTNKLRALKAQKTKLLNKPCETLEDFEEIQNKLNRIELEIKFTEEEMI